jgi:hypothetical protein
MTNSIKKALLISGSPKGKKGASWELGSFVMDQMEKAGVEIRRRSIIPLSENSKLLTDIEWAELVVFSFPLYADGVPSILLREMQAIHKTKPATKFFTVLCNCGFAESNHNKVAIEICRRFALETGWKWLGGIGRGAGGVLGNKTVEEAGGIFKRTKIALIEMSKALVYGEEIPASVIARAEAPLMPKGLYLLAGSLGMFLMLFKNKQLWRYKDRPYDRLPDK